LKQPNLHYYYDAEADIFYFSKGKPSKRAISRELNNDVIARIDPRTGKTVGFTVLNFMKRMQHKTTSIPLPFQLEITPA
jgi:uncharacterized protein YuzE